MRIFKTKWFARFARKEGVEDAALVAGVWQIEAGRVDADLGGGIVKQRLAAWTRQIRWLSHHYRVSVR